MKIINLTLLMTFFLAFSTDAATFRAGTAEWNPYAYHTAEGELAGIAVDIIGELARRTGHVIRVELYPAKRLNMMFEMNELDMNFADSPLWNMGKDRPGYVFTANYMYVEEYLYFKNDSAFDVMKVADLRGKTVGVMLGYYYRELEEEFGSGRIRRHNIPFEAGLLKSLNNQRVDAVILDSVLFNFLLKKTGYDRNEFRRGMRLTNAPLAIKLRIEKKQFLDTFNRALGRMIRDGTARSIIRRYTE